MEGRGDAYVVDDGGSGKVGCVRDGSEVRDRSLCCRTHEFLSEPKMHAYVGYIDRAMYVFSSVHLSSF